MQLFAARKRRPHPRVYTRPARTSALALASVIAVGTFLLMLPISRTGQPPWPQEAVARVAGPAIGDGAPLSAAFFTATSASCVTGLIVVDTETYWSVFGQVVLVILMEIGGLGTMTFGAIMAIFIANRLNLRQRLVVASATGLVSPREISGVVRRIVGYSLVLQAVFAIPILVSLLLRGEPLHRALGHAGFLAVSAFNNAGFSVYSDSLMKFASDPLVLLPISLLIIVGGLGFPVLIEFRRALRSRGKTFIQFSLNTRLVLFGTGMLIMGGWAAIALLEWRNTATMASMSAPAKLLLSFFTAVSPRTAGFNAMDIAAQSEVTWLVTDILMFIGGGPAGTAGGMKITTALVLFFLVVTEVRAGRSVHLFGSRIGRSVNREATTVLVLAFTLVVACTAILMLLTNHNLDRSLFEVTSALGTVGLSTGITPTLPLTAQIMLTLLMFFGRVGPMSIATALAINPQARRFDLPKERPLIG
ncbi:MAG: potassium transporter TrkG [Actinomycetaceae bacterium]|nr:potassium transporter TrkG [Actinomycetaceae bacterium]